MRQGKSRQQLGVLMPACPAIIRQPLKIILRARQLRTIRRSNRYRDMPRHVLLQGQQAGIIKLRALPMAVVYLTRRQQADVPLARRSVIGLMLNDDTYILQILLGTQL